MSNTARRACKVTGKIAVLALVFVVFSFSASDSLAPRTAEEPVNDVRTSMLADAKTTMTRPDLDKKVRYAMAERALTRVADEYGMTGDVLFDLGYCRMQLKDYAGVANACDRVKDRNCPYIHNYRGQLLLKDGKKKEAKAEFEQAILKGDVAAVYFLRRCE